MDLSEVLKYGPDYLARTRETTSYLFLLNVIDSIYMLQTSDFCKNIDVILTTLPWYSNTIQFQLNRKLYDKAIMVVGDPLDELN